MVQLDILSGKMAGSVYRARRFPVRMGRSPAAQLRFEEDGIWDQHLELCFQRRQGFLLKKAPEAFATLNGKPFEQAFLRNGDRIEMGFIKLQFWLAERGQRGLGPRETLTWAGIAAVCLAQVWVIYRLLGG
jgi:hypothetical protein